MDEEADYVTQVLSPCIGTSITAIHEEDYEVFLHLSDGQLISIKSLDDGGFIIDVLTGILH